MIHFLKITVQQKARDDYRAFLDWGDDQEMMVYQIRGYGDTPGKAADDAYRKFQQDPERHVEGGWEWK
jgi:hypothetical protein